MTNIPFQILPPNVMVRLYPLFMGFSEKITEKSKYLKEKLNQAEIKITPAEYLARCISSTIIIFIISLFVFIFLVFSNSEKVYLNSFAGALIISSFIIVIQLNHPKAVVDKRIKDIEKNLLPALRTILIQLHSGVSLFNSLVYISNSDFGELSKIFSEMVKKINTGTPQIKAIEEVIKDNPSLYFRKSMWQLINGMKAGSDVSKVLGDIIDSLSTEQVLQIEGYGSKLNPLAMFYMLLVIIVPALGVTFMTVISSFFSPISINSKTLLIFLFIFVLIFQIIFLGLIKTKRPSLLED